MIAGIAVLVLGALLIAFWVWMRSLQRGYLAELAARVKYHGTATDPWEEPQIVATYGGIHDVDQDEWR